MKRFLPLALCLALVACESHEDRTAAYHAWCKLNDCKNLTLEEWQLLRERYLLPGQDGQAAEARDAALFAAGMAGAAAGSRR